MTNDTKNNKIKLLKALRKHKGVVLYAAKEAKVSPESFYNWRKKDPEFAKAVDFVMDEQIDFVERKLLDNIEAGSDTAILFYLRTKGKKRGYQENSKQEIDMNITQIEFKFGEDVEETKKEDEVIEEDEFKENEYLNK